MDEISLNKNEILKIQQNRGQYLMIDYATNVLPGQYSRGYKDLNDDWFFEIFFDIVPFIIGSNMNIGG